MIDKNVTVALKVATSIDNGLDNILQHILIYFYKMFPTLGNSFFSFTYGQAIFAIFSFLAILIIRPFLVFVLIKFLLKLAKKTDTIYDDLIVLNLKKPLKFTFLILAFYSFFSILYIDNNVLNLIFGSFIIYNLFWYVWSVLTSLQGFLYKVTTKIYSDLSSELSNFIIRLVKLLVWVIGASSILSLWGINVTALLASLGLGGLAFALAAKDTAANLFGSIAILLDKSIKIGDWIKVDGVEGVVEDIGMRTTKLRTFKKSLVVIPNQIVANNNIENFSRRDGRRIKLHIGLTYDTTNEQLESIVSDIRIMLRKHKGIDSKSTILVNFNNFADSAKEIFVYAFSNSAIWEEYLEIREDIHYKISDIVTKNGSSFAFPSETIYLENLPTKVP